VNVTAALCLIPALALWLAAAPGAPSVPLAMLMVFGTAKLLAELFERLNQPGIVGEILAGVLIGPSVLGWMAPNDFLRALADLGVMFLLFRVGLEVKASELLRIGGTALLVAVLGVVVPFVLGWGILLAWGEPQIEAIFMGAAMVATSVGITAQVLAGKGLLSHVASRMILAAAVIDDVLGLLVLALVSSVARGQVNVAGLALTAVLALSFVFVVAKWGSRTVGQVVSRAHGRLRVSEAYFALAMVVLFALAFLAEHVGVAAIVGAFLAGMALSETVDPRVEHLAQGVTELLVPFFLAGIGMHLDIRGFTEPSVVALALAILAAAIFSKLVGCGLGAWRMGWRNMLRVGLGMMPRGEVGMVVAQIGLTMGVISTHVYGVAVFMAVCTTLLAPPFLRLAYRGVAPEPEQEVLRLG
jgi:Kef-type K+ transport system membrane component KefB